MRPRDQLFLFPELDNFKTIIKNIDYVDVSTLVDPNPNHSKLNFYNEIEKDTFFIYKTGHINSFRPELGRIFPYIKNEKTGKLLRLGLSKHYLRASINVQKKTHHSSNSHSCVVDLKMHRIAALAFIENRDPKKLTLVDHKNGDRLDYSVENLRWVDYSGNNTGVSKPRNQNWEETLIKKGVV